MIKTKQIGKLCLKKSKGGMPKAEWLYNPDWFVTLLGLASGYNAMYVRYYT